MKQEELVGDVDLLYLFEDEKTNGYSEEEYTEMLEAIEAAHIPQIGRPFEAVFVAEDEHHFLLDSKFKDYIRVPKTSEERNFFRHVKINNIIDVVVTSISDKREYIINGSVAIIYKGEAHKMLENMEYNSYVDVRVEKLTPAGYTCMIELNGCELEAFLPQVLAGVNRIPDAEKESLVGQKLEMCVETYSKDKGTWIVSRRKYLELLIPEFIEQLNSDTLYKGTVTDTKTYGVFIEFNECLTGMIYKTALLPEYRDNFRNIKAGDEMEFYVKEVNHKNQIVLIQQSTLWDEIKVGQVFEGTVSDHKHFGTLVALDDDNTKGLIRSNKESDDVIETEVGEKVKVKISKIDYNMRRIYLELV